MVKCPHCNSTHLHKWSPKKNQQVKDIPIDGNPVVITIDRKRWKCVNCKKTFLEPIDYLSTNHSMTKRLVEWIKKEHEARSAFSIAKEVGVYSNTIKAIVNEQVVVEQTEES